LQPDFKKIGIRILRIYRIPKLLKLSCRIICLNRTVWLVGKIIQAIGLFEIMYGLIIGLRDDNLAMEFRYAGIGVVIFGIGWLIEKKLAGR